MNPLCTPYRAHRTGARLPGQPLTVTEFHYCPPGRLPHLLRAGRADVSVAVRAGAWRVYALDAAGHRRKEVPATRRDGRLAFKADVSIRPDDATIFYELTCD